MFPVLLILSILFPHVHISTSLSSSQPVLYSPSRSHAVPSSSIVVHGDSCLTSSGNMFITAADKKGLRAAPWCNPTSTLEPSVTPAAHLTSHHYPSALVHILHISYIALYYSPTSSIITPQLSAPCHMFSINP